MLAEDYIQFTSRVDLTIRLPKVIWMLAIVPYVLCLVFPLLFSYWGCHTLRIVRITPGNTLLQLFEPYFPPAKHGKCTCCHQVHHHLTQLYLLGGGGGGVVLVIPKVREGGMRQLRMSMKNSMEEKEDPSIPTVLWFCPWVVWVYCITVCFSPPSYGECEQSGFSVLRIRFSKCITKLLHLCACTVALAWEFSDYAQGGQFRLSWEEVHRRKQKSQWSSFLVSIIL